MELKDLFQDFVTARGSDEKFDIAEDLRKRVIEKYRSTSFRRVITELGEYKLSGRAIKLLNLLANVLKDCNNIYAAKAYMDLPLDGDKVKHRERPQFNIIKDLSEDLNHLLTGLKTDTDLFTFFVLLEKIEVHAGYKYTR